MNLFIPTFQVEVRATEKEGELKEKDHLTYFLATLNSDAVAT